MSELRPTNHCFDDALDYLELALRLGGPAALERHVLVHGVCLMPGNATTPHEPFAHAWVERDDGMVVQAGMAEGVRVFYEMPALHFAVLFRPQRFTKYTVDEAWKENERSGTFGPWLEEYQALTRNAKRGGT